MFLNNGWFFCCNFRINCKLKGINYNNWCDLMRKLSNLVECDTLILVILLSNSGRIDCSIPKFILTYSSNILLMEKGFFWGGNLKDEWRGIEMGMGNLCYFKSNDPDLQTSDYDEKALVYQTKCVCHGETAWQRTIGTQKRDVCFASYANKVVQIKRNIHQVFNK